MSDQPDEVAVQRLREENAKLAKDRERERSKSLPKDQQRLFDLVYHQRGELLEAGLITIHEYGALCEANVGSGNGGSPAPRRLESYDEIRARLTKAETDAEERVREAIEGGNAEAIDNAVGHWFTQGGEMQFGAIGNPTNGDELIAAILTVVRARCAALEAENRKLATELPKRWDEEHEARLSAEAALTTQQRTVAQVVERWLRNADMLDEGNKSEWPNEGAGMQRALALELRDTLAALVPGEPQTPTPAALCSVCVTGKCDHEGPCDRRDRDGFSIPCDCTSTGG